MTQKLTRRGARELTSTLDRIATVIQENPDLLGIPEKVANDYAYRCDLISDAVERSASTNFPLDKSAAADEEGMSVEPTGGFDPHAIGDVTGGPLEIIEPPDEPWMDSHFTSDEFHQLGQLQESGALSAEAAASAKFASLLGAAEARLSKIAAIPSRTQQGPAGFTKFIRELDELANKAAEAKAAVAAAVPQELLDAKKSADKDYAAAQKQLKSQIVDTYEETTNILITRKTKLVEVQAKLQVQRRQVKGLLGLGKQNQAQLDMVEAMVAEYGEGVREFISRTASALNEVHKDTAIYIKGWEMEERAGATRTAGLLDAVSKFQSFIMRGWKAMVRKFQGLLDIVSKGSKELDRSESELMKALDSSMKLARSASDKSPDFAGFNLLG
jgi:hypothetical protein